MTEPLQRPPKKNPQRRSISPTRPPEMRSRAALGLTAAAAEGRLALQCCADCQTWQYPPRDACVSCLSTDLPWQALPPDGNLLAETTVQTSPRLYYRERMPWRMGSVQMDAGPVILANIHPDVTPRSKIRMAAHLDRAGQGVLVAMPVDAAPNQQDAPLMRELTADPKHRRILITDARAANAPALAKALKDAGAAIVFAGEAESWRPYPGRTALQELDVDLMPLDVTDTQSVQTLAGEIGGKTDILINNAQFVRPGGALARGDVGFARDEMDVNYLGLMRLAQAFGPGMCARAADGVNSAVAWVNLLYIGALSNTPDYGAFAASQSAAYSLSQSLRADFRSAGLKVMNVFSGPAEEDWFAPLPPPKVLPQTLARDVVKGLQAGIEDVWCGDIAQDMRDRFRRDPKVLEREMTFGGDGP
ncbi:SDR family oxidoreductase [Rhodophyticola sp. CCM32]|uniref:SDR family oxidoreductase n=1 Tax=Rhodophyticola sp. CCM32 TaxID=2916397 RepID=UPI00107F31FB|nr:SDR family oxidoreductase [Rhodophyticola sp. CCM32]QBY01377.1 SDR family oxidoreductase [Rhodophyticola sp. CCM32]